MEQLDYDHEIKKIKSTKKLRELFSEFKVLAKEALVEFNDFENSEYYKSIYQNLLQRLYIGIGAIDTLFDMFNKNRYYKFAVAIQMRVCILDSITIAYLRLFIDKQDPLKFKEQVIRLNHPIARELLTEIKEMTENNSDHSIDLQSYYKLAMTNFPESFIEGTPLTLNKKIKDLKPKHMADALKGTELDWYSGIYKTYQHFSKYEHYGTLTKKLLEFTSEYEFDKFVLSTFYIFHAAFMAVARMEIDQNKINKFKALRDRIIEVEPTFDIKSFQS